MSEEKNEKNEKDKSGVKEVFFDITIESFLSEIDVEV